MSISRKAKFRAWNRTDKVMYYFSAGLVGFEQARSKALEFCKDGNTKCIDDESLLEYTGLKDNNGKEIYEGDIVESVIPGSKLYYTCGSSNCSIGVAEWIQAYAQYWISGESISGVPDDWGILTSDSDREIEICHEEILVIGNIYENPKLLEAKE